MSGYSGGGKSMIASFEDGTAPAFFLYGLGFEHKHVPETQLYSGLSRRPIFVPSVGDFRQGMLVSIPLHLDTLTGKPDAAALHAALAKRYARSKYVSVMPLDNPAAKGGRIEPEALNETNRLELYVFRQREAPTGGAGRPPRQSRQGRFRRGGAEHAVDAGLCRRLRPAEGSIGLDDGTLQFYRDNAQSYADWAKAPSIRLVRFLAFCRRAEACSNWVAAPAIIPP